MTKKQTKATASGNPLMLLITAIFGPITKSNLYGWIALILVILGLRWIWFEPYKIPSGSMEPTLNGDPRFLRGDRVFVNKNYYGVRMPFTKKYIWEWHDPQRWEIVVFKAAHENPEHNTLIKRVVGLPGERIHIQDGSIYINGEKVEPPDELKSILYYTSELMAPRDQLQKILVQLAQLPSMHPGFVHWDDAARNLVLEVAITDRYPKMLNPENAAVKKFMEDIAVVRQQLEAAGITTMDEARASGAAESIDSQTLQVAKELLILVDAPRLQLPEDMTSPLFNQAAVIEAEDTIKSLKSRLAGMDETAIEGGALNAFFEGVSGRTWRVVNDLAMGLSNRSARTDLKYGLRTEDEYSVIPEGHYLLLGDNSGNSLDGRVTGWVPRGNIVGRAFCIWWPVGHWRDFTGFSHTWWGAGLVYGLPSFFFLYVLAHALGMRFMLAHENWAAAGIRRGRPIIVDVKAYRARIPFATTRRLPTRSGDWVLFAHGGEERMGRVVALAGDPIDAAASPGKPVPEGKCAVAPLDENGAPGAPALVGPAELVAAVYPLMRSRPAGQQA